MTNLHCLHGFIVVLVLIKCCYGFYLPGLAPVNYCPKISKIDTCPVSLRLGTQYISNIYIAPLEENYSGTNNPGAAKKNGFKTRNNIDEKDSLKTEKSPSDKLQ